MSIRELVKTAPSKDIVRLLLLRQGEGEAAPGALIGAADLALSARGREQIERAKRLLTPMPSLQAIYLADLKRAVDSCGLLFDGRGGSSPALPTAPPVQVSALREQSFGAWQGKTWEALRASEGAAVEAFFADPAEGRPPGGESLSEVRRRVSAWWKTVSQKHRGGLVLIVTASAPIRSFLCEALELPLARASRFVPGAGTFTVIDVGPSFSLVHGVGV